MIEAFTEWDGSTNEQTCLKLHIVWFSLNHQSYWGFNKLNKTKPAKVQAHTWNNRSGSERTNKLGWSLA
jgi:hypothetical protein